MAAAVDPSVPPSGIGCGECDAAGGWWVHRWRCAAPAATSVAATIRCPGTQRSIGREILAPIIRSFEPGEDWFWDYESNAHYEGPELAPPKCAILRIRRSLVLAIECRATGPTCSVSKTDSSPRRIDLVGGVGDNRRRLAVDVQGVEEAVQSHRAGAQVKPSSMICAACEMLTSRRR